MAFEDVCVVSKKLTITDEAELTALEKTLGIALPPGYREFMTILGYGEYCSNLAVYSPSEVLERTASYRRDWDKYFFWEEGADVLSKQAVLESVIFGSSFEGDQLIYHPVEPKGVFVLPRHDWKIYTVPEGFFNPLSWYDGDEQTKWPDPIKFFKPYNTNEASIVFINTEPDIQIEDLVNLLAPSFEQIAYTTTDEKGFWFLFLPSIGGLGSVSSKSSSDPFYLTTIWITYDIEFTETIYMLTGILEKRQFRIRE